MTDPKVDAYIERSELWPEELATVRPLLLKAGLTEEIKWGKPCFSLGDANIAILQEMKDFLALMFFKGALMDDPEGLLEEQGPNTRAARRVCFRSVDDVASRADPVVALVRSAIAVEEAGLELGPPPDLVLADELQDRLDQDEALKSAFEGLTPGRQREYNLHVSGAKQSATRATRVERNVQKILDGKGLRDR